ncbi:hypothetical protein MSG28_012253 [Choristoneura fumiferana]|uniref:Uncharacterized protein n=1 Tax=Choristoneura fumiferana TaxID=7141 RepID=A0ACC0KCD0_CHOFU|nr:hypothetical protein MSG28_012253 [Choristoneura fumiferana]
MPVLLCGGCKGGINVGQRRIKCSCCNLVYHSECVNFNGDSPARASWKCPNCLAAQRKGGNNSNTPLRSSGPTPESIPEQLVMQGNSISTISPDNDTELVHGLALEHATVVELKSFIKSELEQFKQELIIETKRELTELRKDFADLAGSFQKCTEKVDNLEERVLRLESDWQQVSICTEKVDDLKERVLKLESGWDQTSVQGVNEHRELQSVVESLKVQLNQGEQEMLLNDVDITGLPESPNEDVTLVLTSVAAKLGVALSVGDIVSVRRVGSTLRNQVEGDLRPRPIVARFTRKALRDQLIKNARKRRITTTVDLGMPGESKRIYINERLTSFNRALFRKSRDMGQAKRWNRVWTRDGAIYVRSGSSKSESGHRIRSEMDLARFSSSTQPSPACGTVTDSRSAVA